MTCNTTDGAFYLWGVYFITAYLKKEHKTINADLKSP